MFLTLLRHGETEGNLNGKWQGDTDSKLTETGRDQVLQVAGDILPRLKPWASCFKQCTCPIPSLARRIRVSILLSTGVNSPLSVGIPVFMRPNCFMFFCGIPFPVMRGIALRADPFPFTEFQLVGISTMGAHP